VNGDLIDVLWFKIWDEDTIAWNLFKELELVFILQ